MLIDRFGRRITNLRIAVTMKCNLRCFYCHREGQANGEESELSVSEIAEIARAFYDLGIKKVKITGGEPLLRKDICDIISSMPPFQEISITTNGTLLAEKAEELRESGLDRVNVSLDSLRPETYRRITGGDVEKVVDGIKTACEIGLTPVKVNMVVMKGINDDQVEEMVEFVSSMNRDGIRAILQLIEVLKLPGLERYHLDISGIERKIASKAEAVLLRGMHFRRQYSFETASGNAVVEFVKPVDNSEFCAHCNRIRVTSDGRVKPCLLREDNTVNVRGLKGEELLEAIKKAVELREPYFRD